MASLNRAPLWAHYPHLSTGGLTFSNFVVDGTTDRVEWVFQLSEAVTITRLGFRYGARTGTPVQHKISLQGVDASGLPDGTIKVDGSSVEAYALFTPPATTGWDGLVQWQTLTGAGGFAGYAGARGELVSVVIEPVGTPDASNSSSFTTDVSALGNHQFPVAIQNNAGTRTKRNACPLWGYGSVGTAYGLLLQSAASVSIATSASPDEYGLAFTVPAAASGTFKVVGVATTFSGIAANTPLYLTLYSGTTVLQQISLDSDLLTLPDRWGSYYFDEATLETLSCGTEYILALTSGGTGGSNVRTITAAAAADLACLPWGTAWYLVSRNIGASWPNATAWTTDTASRLVLCPILDDATEPAWAYPAASRIYAGQMVTKAGVAQVTGTLHASNIATAAGGGEDLDATILLSGHTVDDVTGSATGGGGGGGNSVIGSGIIPVGVN